MVPFEFRYRRIMYCFVPPQEGDIRRIRVGFMRRLCFEGGIGVVDAFASLVAGPAGQTDEGGVADAVGWS